MNSNVQLPSKPEINSKINNGISTIFALRSSLFGLRSSVFDLLTSLFGLRSSDF